MSMDFYYRKLMGNGTIASKFRLNVNQSDVRKPQRGDSENLPLFLESSFETSESHHRSNCVRCYRLKKKCSRTYPRCSYCTKTGSECEYVDRQTKRRKKKLRNSESDPQEPSSSVSIASLVHREETEELFHHIDLPATESNVARQVLSDKKPPKSPRNVHESATRGIVSSLHSGMIRSSDVGSRQQLHDQFLVVRAIEDVSLPLAFVYTFFANYEWKYPFLSLTLFLEKFKDLTFTNDIFVNMDVYLVMAVGCILYDSSNNTQHYQDFFSDKLIESIVDVISYDIRSEEDLHTAHLLILLCIWAINVSNGNLVWNVVGFLNRLLIFLTDFTGKNNQCMRKRCFWSIFNLDKELSLLLDKPSQFMPTQIIKVQATFEDTLHDGERESLAPLMKQSVEIHLLQDMMISLKLGLLEKLPEMLTEYSSNLDKWRVATLLLIHTEYAELPLLQNFIGLVNLDYYYLLIELDQLSSTESFQFTLQFLSNSFSLLLNELSVKKGVVGTSLYSLFWFNKFFKVVDFNLKSLLRILELSKAELTTVLAEFSSNLQLIINLLKFLINSTLRPEQYLDKLNGCVAKLTLLNSKLLGFNSLGAGPDEVTALGKEVETIIA